ncbi:MAG TPA: class I SAM-dependent methyltransferase [Candidatus Anammoximicrobium sp.]|nr:class I SAM-dependent methyltransferase [Candidatus Anammoximicrobium sp.]
MPIYPYHRTTCRLCESSQLELVVPFAPTPIADAYVPREQIAEIQPCYPLDMYQCRTCGHVQLLDVVDPRLLFGQYSYFSGRSAGLVRHFQHYADNVIRKTAPSAGSLVVDIGSNDGCFLRSFQERGYRVLGIDPAENVARAANEAGIETLAEFFDGALAERLARDRGRAQVVAANNVFAHTDDMAGMADAVRTLLADDGVFVFEVSYLLDVIDHMLLGTVFHEHVCYHAVTPLDAFLRRHGLELIDAERVAIQGGSLIGTAQRLGGPRKTAPAVAELQALERRRALHDPSTLRAFSARIEAVRVGVSSLVQRLQDEGNTLAGFGAARGGTLLIYHFGLGPILRFIVDDSPDKQGLYSPGFHIPVLPTAALYEQQPEYAFILAWVHSKPIIQNHRRYLEAGGRFITCFPNIEIVTRDSPPIDSHAAVP